jgi:hypothetical protein
MLVSNKAISFSQVSDITEKRDCSDQERVVRAETMMRERQSYLFALWAYSARST